MRKKLTGALVIVGKSTDCPDLEYASGFRAVDPVVLVQKGKNQWLVVPRLEFGRAKREVKTSAFREHYPRVRWHVETLTPNMLNMTRKQSARFSEWVIHTVKYAGARSVTVPPPFPHGIARQLEQAGIKVVVAKTELFPERAIKTNDELRKIRQSQQAAVIAMRTAIAMIAGSEIDRQGFLRSEGNQLTSERLRGVIEKVLVEHECFCRELIVAGGRQSADPHEMGEGPLRAHEPIVIDIFPQHLKHGYWGDLTRTVVRGRASPRLRRMYAAVRAAQSVALSSIRAGTRCSAVHRRAVAEFKRRHFVTQREKDESSGFIHSTGHGVGLAIHETPSLGFSSGRLKARNVVTVEPGLYYPDVGGVRIEDTVVVTSQGWRYLVPCEKRLEV
jgi:Xaa-Pro aminopeptidase